MAEEFLGCGIWNVENGKAMGLGRDEGWQTEGEGAVKGREGGSKWICDFSRKVIELKWGDTAT